jgi:hypothetical protein
MTTCPCFPAEMFIFPERQTISSTPATTSAATTTEEEEEETSTTTETPEVTSETPVTSAGPTVTSSERKIIINLKDIYHCPTTGNQQNDYSKNCVLKKFCLAFADTFTTNLTYCVV